MSDCIDGLQRISIQQCTIDKRPCIAKTIVFHKADSGMIIKPIVADMRVRPRVIMMNVIACLRHNAE